MLKRFSGIELVLFLLLLLSGLSFPAYAQDVKVTLIEVQGNKRIETATILAKIKTKEGELFSPSRIKEDITALYQLGHFEDIQVMTEGFESGLKVIFVIREKPLIREIRYEGNEEIDTDKLKEVVTLLPRTAYNVQLIHENAEKIRMKYQDDGYYTTTVLPIITELRSGDRSITFFIDEGEKIELSEVVITGNKAISSREIRKLLKTQEHWFFSFLGRSGTLRTEELREDVETIKNLYYNKGYIQVQVDEPVVERTSEDEVAVKIHINEGEQFTVGYISPRGNTVLASDEIMSAIKIKRGDVFSREMLRRDVTRIMERYDGIARPFANVVPQFDIDAAKRTVDIIIDIDEGGEVRIGRINVSGNIKTRDKVIRREFRLDEGDLYSKKALKRSYDRLNNLNFFESIDIVPERRLQEPIMDLNVKVKEKLTGNFSIGGGYSSVDGLVGIAEITQGNLGGRGQLLKLKLQWGGIHDVLILSFMEPYLFDKPVWGKIDLYSQSQEYDGYTVDTKGFGLGIGKAFTEYTSASVRYSWDESTIVGIDSTKYQPDSSLDEQIKTYGLTLKTNALSFTLTRDSRDFYLDPRTGSRNSLFVQYAGGVLGGDPAFSKEEADSAWYFPLFWDTVIMGRGRIGYVSAFDEKKLPISERFFVGGSTTVRGFKYGTAGPLDAVKDSFDNILYYNRIGGNKELILNFEYGFPIVPEARLKGVLFYDIGRAFNDDEHIRYRDLRHALGWGIRWFSPIGPLRFEWGYIVNQKPGDQASNFEFSIGSLF